MKKQNGSLLSKQEQRVQYMKPLSSESGLQIKKKNIPKSAPAKSIANPIQNVFIVFDAYSQPSFIKNPTLWNAVAMQQEMAKSYNLEAKKKGNRRTNLSLGMIHI
jgi:hypothetical protein